MRPWLNRALAAVLDAPAPENHPAIGVLAFEFEPDIESIHGSARKEVPNLARAHNHVNARGRSRGEHGAGMIDGRGNLAHFADNTGGCRFRFLADGKTRHGLRGVAGPPLHLGTFAFDR